MTGCGVTQFLIPFRQALEIQAFMVMTCTWNRVVLTADGLAARCACRQPLPAVPRPPEYLKALQQRHRSSMLWSGYMCDKALERYFSTAPHSTACFRYCWFVAMWAKTRCVLSKKHSYVQENMSQYITHGKHNTDERHLAETFSSQMKDT